MYYPNLQSNKTIKKLYYFILLSLIVFSHCLANPTDKIDNLEILLLSVKINGVKIPDITTAYLDKQQQLWISDKDLVSWGQGSLTSEQSFLIINNEKYFQLGSFKDLKYTLDKQSLNLDVNLAANHLSTTIIDDKKKQLSAIRPTLPGLYLNYDAAVQHNSLTKTINYSTFTELVFFNRYGVGVNTLLFKNLSTRPKSIRLETSWTQDQPENIARWRLGDAITSATYWSGAVRFIGAQYATNFNTQPNLITFPQPNIKNVAVLPSTVSVFVNNVLMDNVTVKPGPFIINNIPVVTGSGDVSVITQDLLGRQQVIVVPYYTSQPLLKSGLSAFSYETGVARENFGLQSNDYSNFIASGTYSRGISDTLTAGWHAELLPQQQTLGFTGRYLLNHYGILSSSVAGSLHHAKTGVLGAIGFNRESLYFSHGIQAIISSADFRRIGLLPKQLSPRAIIQAHIGKSFDNAGTISASYTLTKNRDPLSIEPTIIQIPDSQIITTSYNRNFLKNIYFNLSVVTNLYNHRGNQIMATLSYVFRNTHFITTNTSYQPSNHSNQEIVQLSKNIPIGVGDWYSLYAAKIKNSYNMQGEYSMQTDVGTFAAKASRISNRNNLELDARGSMLYFAENIFFSRPIIDSFALVKIPELKEIPVFYRNQFTGITNNSGSVLIPNILPYQSNNISINAKDLPLSTIIESTNQEVTPYYRSGILVKFPIRKAQALMLTLISSDGNYISTGTKVTISSSSGVRDLSVGYDGLIYIDDIGQTNLIEGTAFRPNGPCRFKMSKPSSMEVIYSLGKVTCL